ncbi:hypothetical protein HU200_010825 [Digitaria exilis]|uniref:1-phosphatidylinositol-4-phosphate 5-kinase n=1 Tax=Digitaria exilis TaxID=1010633 RepID=A0A835FIH9_9POAL|nr:hypothetical protein HU200_010825 [Digitaria exilis]
MRRVAPAMIGVGGAGGEETAEGAVVEKTLQNGDVYRGGFSQGAPPHGKGKVRVGGRLHVRGGVAEGEGVRERGGSRGRPVPRSRGSFAAAGSRAGRVRRARRRHPTAARGWRTAATASAPRATPTGTTTRGQWRRNLQDGHGRYVWATANQYVGEWRYGVLSGRGVLIWPNGSRYDGVWENGVPKGTGVFTWPDGSRYIGSWPGTCLDLPAISGTFFARRWERGLPAFCGKSAAVPTRALIQADFDPKEKFWTRFPPEGSKITPPHSSAEFRWKDYSRAEQASRRSEFDPYLFTGVGFLFPNQTGEVHDVILYFGIIDILQDYDLTKKLEHVYKSFHTDPNSISAVDPKLYSKRFQDFIGRIFVEDDG